MKQEDLRYLAKIVRRYCKKYDNVEVIPDYELACNVIEVKGLPEKITALTVVTEALKDKNVKIFGKETKITIRL